MKAVGFNNYNIWALIALGFVLFIVSLFIHQSDNYPIYRTLRGVICFTYFGVYILYKKKKIHLMIAGFFLFYGLSSIASNWYETKIFATLTMTFNLIAYLILVRALWPKVNFKKLTLLFKIIFTALILVNGYLLYEFVAMIRDQALNNVHYILILVSTMSAVLMAFLGLLYNYKYSTRASLKFIFFILVLIFSEVFRAIGYYDFAYGNYAVYTARALLIVALILLIQHAIIPKNNNEELGTIKI